MNLLIALDLAESSEQVAAHGQALASALGSKAYVLHVAAPEPDFVGYDVGPQTVRDSVAEVFHREHREIQAIAENFRAAGVDAQALLVQGPTVATILEQADKFSIAMIVLGSHGKGVMNRLLVGSVSEGVLRGSECPVVVVPTHR